jgi:spermidine/putrescine transport system permease protein
VTTREGTGVGRRLERILAGHTWFVYAFFYLPILILVVLSFNESRFFGQWEGLSLRWYRQMFDNDNLMAALRQSIVVALISTAISTVLGTAAAIALERYRRWLGKRTFDALLYLPVIIPDVTMAAMLLVFFTSLNQQLSTTTIVLSHIAFNISFVSIVVRARLANLDPSLEEAAADLYAGRWQAFRRVTLPLIMPGVLGGALLALTLSLDDVVITQFVKGPDTLPTFVFGLIKRGVTPEINAVSTLMLAASVVLVLGSLVLQRRQ